MGLGPLPFFSKCFGFPSPQLFLEPATALVTAMGKRGRKQGGRKQPKPEAVAGDASWQEVAFERISGYHHAQPEEEHRFAVESQSPHGQPGQVGPRDVRPRPGNLDQESFRRHRLVTGSLLTGFEPQRHTMFVEGRPTQVLVLTHEGARAPVTLPYLGAKWFPMPILNLFGRSARADPAIHSHGACWYGWRDMGFHLRCRVSFPKCPGENFPTLGVPNGRASEAQEFFIFISLLPGHSSEVNAR